MLILTPYNIKYKVNTKKNYLRFIRLTRKRIKAYSWKYKKRLLLTKNNRRFLEGKSSQKILKKLYYASKKPKPKPFRFFKKSKNYFPRRFFFKGKRRPFTTNSSFLSLLKYKNYEFKDSGSAYVFKKASLHFKKVLSFTFLRFVPIFFGAIPLNELQLNIAVFDKNPVCTTNTQIFFFNFFFKNTPLYRKKFYYFNSLKVLDLYKLKRNPLHTNFSFKYLTGWLFILLHKFLLKRFNKNRLLGLYPVSKRYFFFNDIFFPSFSNIKIFYKSLRRNKHNSFLLKKPMSKDLIISNKIKRSLPYLFFSKNNKANTITKKCNLLYKWMYMVASLRFRKKKRYALLRYIRRKFFFLKKVTLKKLYKKKIRKGVLRKYILRRASNRHLKSLNFIDYIYKPFSIPILNKFNGRIRYRGTLLNNNRHYKHHAPASNNGLTLMDWNVKTTNFFFKNFFLAFFIFRFSYFIKVFLFNWTRYYTVKNSFFYNKTTSSFFKRSNILPDSSFNIKLNKVLVLSRLNFFLKENIAPWTYNNVLRFIEFCSGKKVLLQLYSFMNQAIDLDFILLYKRWLPRFFYFERRLGHRFFLEEALHILHMGFNLHDIKIVSSWLKAIITRISFWKTRFIFRFIKYIFNNYFFFLFPRIGIKGFKIKLKGKISVAGNSRKRTILYRVGKTSHATCELKVLHNFSTIVTFTGVMGLQVWIFY